MDTINLTLFIKATIMLSPDDLLKNLTQGPAIYMAYVASIEKQRLEAVRARRGRKAFNAKDWQHITNAITNPLTPCPPHLLTMARFIKKEAIRERDNPIRFRELMDIHSGLVNGDKEQLEWFKNFLLAVRTEWDWQMFANGLLADN